MQCPNCQNTVPDSANVCGYCGTRLRQPAPLQPPPQPPPEAVAAPPPVQSSPPPAPVYTPPVQPAPVSRRRKIPVWIWIIGILLCLCITLALIWAVFFSDITINLGSNIAPSIPPAAVEIFEPSSTPAFPTAPPEPTPFAPTVVQAIQVEPFDPTRGEDFPSLRSLADDQGVIHITANTAVKFGWGWCAATPEILDQNFVSLVFKFILDGYEIPLSKMYLFDETKEGNFCRSYLGLIRTWPVGEHTIEYRREVIQNLDDGLGTSLPKGDVKTYFHTIIVSP